MAEVRSRYFGAGEKVEVHKRFGGNLSGGERALSSEKVGSDGELVVSGLDVGQPVWLVADRKDELGNESRVTVQATGKDYKDSKQMSQKEITERLAQTRPVESDDDIVTGARGTGNTRPKDARARLNERVRGATVKPEAHEPGFNKGEVEHQPYPKQANVPDDQPQRSDTPVGAGYPTDANEPQPHARQEDVKDSQPQRSDTPTGEAEPILDGEDHSPAPRQQDVKGPQRSSTPFGEATRIGTAEPRGSAKNESSLEQAAGLRPVPDLEQDQSKVSKVKPDPGPKVEKHEAVPDKPDIEKPKEDAGLKARERASKRQSQTRRSK